MYQTAHLSAGSTGSTSDLSRPGRWKAAPRNNVLPPLPNIAEYADIICLKAEKESGASTILILSGWTPKKDLLSA